MIIQLKEWEGWRIAGSNTDWQIQKRVKRKNGNDTWEGTNFYTSLKYALDAAFERTLRESPATVDNFADYVEEINRVKSELINCTRAARA